MAAPKGDKGAADAADPKRFVGASQEEIAAALESGELALATREQVTDAKDTKTEFVVVPEWDCGVVEVQSLRKGQQIELVERAKIDDELDETLYQVLTLISGCAKPEFKQEDIEKLKQRNARAFNRVLDRIFYLSAMGPYALSFEEEQEASFRDESG